MEQELAVAFGAEDGRVDDVGMGCAEGEHCCFHFFYSGELRGLVADDAAFAYVFASSFELRFYQNDQMAALSLGWVEREGCDDYRENQRR